MDTTVVTNEDLKDAISFVLQVEKTVASDLSDGKISLVEVAGFLPIIMKLPNLIAKKDAIIVQAKTLTLDEVKDIMALIGVNITDASVIDKIEAVLNLAVAAKNAVVVFTTKKAA